jgi:hypothetical protein
MNPHDVLTLDWNERQKPVIALLVDSFGEWVTLERLLDAFYADRERPACAKENFRNLLSNWRIRAQRLGFTIIHDAAAPHGQKHSRVKLVTQERR